MNSALRRLVRPAVTTPLANNAAAAAAATRAAAATTTPSFQRAAVSTTSSAHQPKDMALSSYNPDRFLSVMERFFDDVEPRWARPGTALTLAPATRLSGTGGKLSTWRPSCDVRETDQAFLIQAEVPGAKKEDIRIDLEGNTLRISGEVKEEKVNKTDTYFQSERSYGNFMRSFAMPDTADLDNVKAEHANGVLHVTVPKKPRNEPPKRQITVQ